MNERNIKKPHAYNIASGSNRRAILVEPSQQSVDDAERFGRVICMFEEDGSRPSIWRNDELRQAVCRRLAELGYDPKNDYIVLTGQTVILTFVVAIVANEYGPFKVLAFSAPDRAYIERVFG